MEKRDYRSPSLDVYGRATDLTQSNWRDSRQAEKRRRILERRKKAQERLKKRRQTVISRYKRSRGD